MKTTLLTTAAVAMLFALPVAPALAQDSSTTQAQQDQSGQEQLQQQDRQFVEQAAADNQAELELARTAQDKAASDEVKEYARTLVNDHTVAGEELQRIAEEQGLTLETELSQEAQQAQEQLSGESGDAFDRAFVEQMVSDHEKAVQLYEDQAANGQNDALKQFASATVDTLRMHLDRARQLERQMGEQPVAGTPGGTPSASQQESMAGSEDQSRIGTQQAQDTGQQGTGQQSSPEQDNPLMGMTVGDIIGDKVVNQEGEEVGEIQDVVIGRQDKVTHAIVSVGGFLGIGDKTIAIAFDELQPGQEEGQVLLTSGASVDELKERPAYEEDTGDYDSVPPEQTPGGSAM